MAARLANAHPDTTSFYRFADFVNYYPRRKAADEYIRQKFIANGRNPSLTHPYSFVLFESDYLNEWFDKGGIIKVPIKDISSEQISFTIGDSCPMLSRTDKPEVYTKDMLENEIVKRGSIENYREKAQKQAHYIEVQIWCELENVNKYIGGRI